MDRHGFFFILLFIFNITYMKGIETSNNCNDIKSKSVMLRLKRFLLCQYDTNIRPVQNNNNVTRVKFGMMPHFFDYNDENEIFSLHTWIELTWNDSHFTWVPSRFEDIKWIFIPNYEIWTPDISLHNSERIGESSSYGQIRCWVYKDGLVRWVTPAKYSTYCFADNTWWPYNIMNCTIQFGSWSHSGDEIELTFNESSQFHNVHWNNNQWKLLNVHTMEWENRYKFNSDSTIKMLSYHFILRRHGSDTNIVYISPIIVLMVMTLTALWLEPKSFERMVIANLNFICHLLCIQIVHWEIPKSGFNTPKLLIFYESSLAIASFTLILTSILRHLQELTTEPPIWISAGTTSILRSRVGQILLISILDPAVTAKIETYADDNTDLVQSNSKRSPWRYVVVLVGWLAFLSVSLAYIVLLSAYLPMYYTVIP